MLITMERRGLFEVFPEKMRKVWKNWQPRSLVVFSVLLQVALILLGKVRKHNGKPLLRFTVWSTYLLADWVATVALGVIANYVQDNPNNSTSFREDLVSFWAPFLLLHLGGPDTITAYSLEDNELWQRKLLQLVTQVIMVIYVFFLALPGVSSLTILTIPMLVAGLLKFGERVYSLRSASTEQFRLSLMTDPDPGPNYSKFMAEFTLRKAEGFYVRADEFNEAPLPTALSTHLASRAFRDEAFSQRHVNFGPPNPVTNEKALCSKGDLVACDTPCFLEVRVPTGRACVENEQLILKAHELFQVFKRLFADLILSFQDRDDSQSFFKNLDPQSAFGVIEVELGFAYDVFYTKTPAIYNCKGFILRLITFFAILSSLLAFIFILRRDHFLTIDLIITYLLLVAAIILEVNALRVMVFSDWTIYWLEKHDGKSRFSILKHHSWTKRKRWSNLIAQYNMLSICLEKQPSVFARIRNSVMPDDILKKIQYTHHVEVSKDLKDLIFTHFLKISQSGSKNDLTCLCRSRGTNVLEKYDCELNWSIAEGEFDQSILLWHIATDLCYYSDSEMVENPQRIESKHMSDYMLYLLEMCPLMLPIGIGMIRFRDTCAEAQEFFKERREEPDKAKACRMLLRVNTEVPPAKVKGDRSKSVLFDACRLATELRAKGHTKWEIISQVWVEILAYAACHCRGNRHAQQLRKGGEFLTHVWLLMAHLGITEQFQIWQGHARAKLSAK